MNSLTILISGATGLIGRSIIKKINSLNISSIENKYRIIAAVRDLNNAKNVLDGVCSNTRIQYISYENSQKLNFTGPIDYIICAGTITDRNTILKHPAKTYTTNLNGIYNRQSLASLMVILCIFFGLAFFAKDKGKDHLNVVLENKNKKLLVEDIQTKEQRILDWRFALENVNRLKYLQPGDTVNVRINDNNYITQKTIFLNPASLDFSKDSIYARQKREVLNAKKQEMVNQR